MTEPAGHVFGNNAQKAVLRKARALFDVVRGDGRFSSHGRVVGLVGTDSGPMSLIARLAELQGATHYACIGKDLVQQVLAKAPPTGLQATHYARWEIKAEDLHHASQATGDIQLPDGLTLQPMTPETPHKVIASFAHMSLGCGVLPAWLSAHMGLTLPARTLMAVTDEGRVVSSAYASGYITDGSDRAQRECFWGMLVTDPDWRGQRLSVLLGGLLLQQMHTDFGFTDFYTGVEPGNVPSEAVCARLGLRKSGRSIVTFADARHVPGGRMTK